MSDEKPSNEFDVNLSTEDSGDNSSTEIISEILPQEGCAEISSEQTESTNPPLAVSSDNEIPSEIIPLTEILPGNETSSEGVQPSPIPANDNSEILTLLRKLDRDFETKLRYDKTKQESIDKLYKENCDYRDNIIETLKQKLVFGVIEQLDYADKAITTFESKGESEKTFANLLSSFQEITEDFRLMLQNRFDVYCFRSEPGTLFVHERQKVMQSLPTGDVLQDKTIIKSRRFGYENASGTVLRSEFVDVYYYDKTLDVPHTENVADNSTLTPSEMT